MKIRIRSFQIFRNFSRSRRRILYFVDVVTTTVNTFLHAHPSVRCEIPVDSSSRNIKAQSCRLYININERSISFSHSGITQTSKVVSAGRETSTASNRKVEHSSRWIRVRPTATSAIRETEQGLGCQKCAEMEIRFALGERATSNRYTRYDGTIVGMEHANRWIS